MSGWIVLLGQNTGSNIGGEIATMMGDCEDESSFETTD